MSDLTARDLIVRAMGLLPTDGAAFRSLVAALDALIAEEDDEEDCDLWHNAANQYHTLECTIDEDPTAGFLIPQDGHGEAF